MVPFWGLLLGSFAYGLSMGAVKNVLFLVAVTSTLHMCVGATTRTDTPGIMRKEPGAMEISIHPKGDAYGANRKNLEK